MSDIHKSKPGLVRKALILEWILIAYNVLEAGAAILFGFLAGSIALVGFGFDSVIEVAAAGILIWRLSHHGTEEEEIEKEKKALYFVGVTFFLLAGYILYESGTKLIFHEIPDKTLPGIIIAVMSLCLMPLLGFKKRELARKMGSRALEADAVETFVCAYLSFSLLLGVGLHALFGWWWADPVAALAMVYFIVREGREAIRGVHCC